MKTRILFLVLAASMAGCAPTIAPHRVVTHEASYDGNTQNSGIISSDSNGFVVTQHFLDRHGFKIGDGIVPEGRNYRITAEIMSKAIDLDQTRKNQ